MDPTATHAKAEGPSSRQKSCCLTCSIIILGILVSFAVFTYKITAGANYYQSELGVPLREDLGFTGGSPYLRFDGAETGVEVFTIEEVTTGGLLQHAGVQNGDLPLQAPNDFYRMLHEARGTTITFTVVHGGDGPAPEKRPKRQIKVFVPAE